MIDQSLDESQAWLQQFRFDDEGDCRWCIGSPRHHLDCEPECPVSVIEALQATVTAQAQTIAQLTEELESERQRLCILRREFANTKACHQCGGQIGENARCAECDEDEREQRAVIAELRAAKDTAEAALRDVQAQRNGAIIVWLCRCGTLNEINQDTCCGNCRRSRAEGQA